MARKINVDDTELKRRSYRRRFHEQREIVCRILIVCEGSKTEPGYFRAFHRKKRGTIVFDLELEGGGINTIGVVKKAIELKESAEKGNLPYDRVWAVFDKDSFPPKNFNAAIFKAKEHHIECAWSNEAFELWYLLHFCDRCTPMCRTDYQQAISKAVNSSFLYRKKKKYVYAKNDPETYEVINLYGNQSRAIKRASGLEKCYDNESFATHNPCTTVYKLVKQLIGEDEILNGELLEKGNEK